MPKSKMQAEFVKATKVDPDEYESRQDFLVAVVEKVNTFKDAQWNKLSEEAQDWINDAIKKVKAKKRVAEFPDVGSVPKDDEEDEAPAKKKKAKPAADEEDDEEEEATKKKKKAVAEEDEDEADDEDEESGDDEADDDEEEEADEDEEDEEEDEPPAKKKKAVAKKTAKKKAKPAADDDDDEDEEDEEEDEPAPKKKKKAKPTDDDEDEDDEKPAKKKKAKASDDGKVTGVKVAIKTAIIEDPEITVDALIKKLSKGGAAVSKVTVSNVRSEFRHTLKTLKQLGKLKGVDI